MKKKLHFVWIPAAPPWWKNPPCRSGESSSPALQTKWAIGQKLQKIIFMRITFTNHRCQLVSEKRFTLSCSLFIVSISTALQVGNWERWCSVDFDFKKTSPPHSVAGGWEEIEQGMNSRVSHAFSNNSEMIFGHVIRGTRWTYCLLDLSLRQFISKNDTVTWWSLEHALSRIFR